MRRYFLISVVFFLMALWSDDGECEVLFAGCRGYSFYHLVLNRVSVWLSACDFEFDIISDDVEMNVITVSKIPGLRTYEVLGNGVIAGHSPSVVIINSSDGLFVNGMVIPKNMQNMLIGRGGEIFPHMFYRTYD